MLVFLFALPRFYSWIAGTMAFKIFVKVDAGDYPGFVLTLRENNAQVFFIFCFSLEGKSWTGPSIAVTPVQVDHAIFHNFLYIRAADPAAIHPAQCVFGIRQFFWCPVKQLPTGGFHPSLIDKNRQQQEDEKQRNSGSFPVHQ